MQQVLETSILLNIEYSERFLHSSNDLNHGGKYEQVRLYSHLEFEISPGCTQSETTYLIGIQ